MDYTCLTLYHHGVFNGNQTSDAASKVFFFFPYKNTQKLTWTNKTHKPRIFCFGADVSVCLCASQLIDAAKPGRIAYKVTFCPAPFTVSKICSSGDRDLLEMWTDYDRPAELGLSENMVYASETSYYTDTEPSIIDETPSGEYVLSSYI